VFVCHCRLKHVDFDQFADADASVDIEDHTSQNAGEDTTRRKVSAR
jgi:hypothetical protein